MHQKYWCTGSQGPQGLGYSPLTASSMLLQARKQSSAVSCQWPLPRMWHHTHHTEFPVDGMCGVMSPHTSYSGSIKAVAPLSQGVLLPLRKTENLSTPPASWVTMIPPQALPGHPAVLINYRSSPPNLEMLFCWQLEAAISSWLDPTGTAHQNRVPVPVLLTLIHDQLELSTGVPSTSSRIFRISGKTTRSRYRICVPGWALIWKACLDRAVIALPETNVIVAIAHSFQVRSQRLNPQDWPERLAWHWLEHSG